LSFFRSGFLTLMDGFQTQIFLISQTFQSDAQIAINCVHNIIYQALNPDFLSAGRLFESGRVRHLNRYSAIPYTSYLLHQLNGLANLCISRAWFPSWRRKRIEERELEQYGASACSGGCRWDAIFVQQTTD